MKKRLYVDMDGTLAVFNNHIESEEELFRKGYFENLSPQKNVVTAVRMLSHLQSDIEIFVLSAVLPTPYAQREKNQWIDKYLPEINQAHRIYVPCGEDKGNYIDHALGKGDMLLDDYSKNLHAWCPPGSAIKLMNGINGNFGTWQGNRISHKENPKEIANYIAAHLELQFHSSELADVEPDFEL